MLRVLFEFVIPLVLPLTLYLLWQARRRRIEAATGGVPPAWFEGPWFWAVVAGFVLAAGVLVVLALTSGAKPGAEYIPPHLENGRVVPAQTR